MMRGGRDCCSISTLTQPISPHSSHTSCITGCYHFSPSHCTVSWSLSLQHLLYYSGFISIPPPPPPHTFFCHHLLFLSFLLLHHFTLSFSFWLSIHIHLSLVPPPRHSAPWLYVSLYVVVVVLLLVEEWMERMEREVEGRGAGAEAAKGAFGEQGLSW